MAISSGCALWKMQVDFPDIRERRLQFGSSLVDDIRASKSPNESPIPEGRGFIDELYAVVPSTSNRSPICLSTTRRT
ncbi:hypothetical protein TNCV_3599241 [Trichonephila clavipes]|nr:hypothetical protein TNCV_3599241 [Trichonephila clavipes]